ncbi:MAG: MBL fold metallo-hydrolase [Rhizobium oryzihabitans]
MAIYRRRFTVLGCASSPGVPRINGDWGACDPENPRNRRTRTAFMVEQIGPDGGKTTVVIDTGPDFREQMIAAKVEAVDAVLYTHAHADHLHGIDDLRIYFAIQQNRIPIYADPVTMARIWDGFAYCLETPPGSSYPPIVEPRIIADIDAPLIVEGAGGPIPFNVHMQQHGDVHSLGFRIGDVAYCTDALQHRYHPSHLSLEQALGWIERFAPKRAILTHMHIPLDYDTVIRETPDHVEPAYDQMRFEVEIEIEAP